MQHIDKPLRLPRGLLLLSFGAGLMAAYSGRATEPTEEFDSLVTVKVLHSFEGLDGAMPSTPLILGTDGKVHGVAGHEGGGHSVN